MQYSSMLLLLCALATGAAVPFQAGANAALGRTLGHPLWGTMVSLAVSVVCILPVMIMARVQVPALPGLAAAPKWAWIGGVIGVFYITAALVVAPKLGAASFVTSIIAGQMLASVLIDYWGLVGFVPKPLSAARFLGLALIFLGIVVMQGPALWETTLSPTTPPSNQH